MAVVQNSQKPEDADEIDAWSAPSCRCCVRVPQRLHRRDTANLQQEAEAEPDEIRGDERKLATNFKLLEQSLKDLMQFGVDAPMTADTDPWKFLPTWSQRV